MGQDNLLKKILVLIFLNLLYFSLFSESQKVYSIRRYQNLYDDLERLQLESGISPISTVYPYTEQEFVNILASIDSGNLSATGLNNYNSIISRLNLDTDKNGLTYGLDIYVNAETYLQTNKDNDTWIYDYNERKPVVDFELTMGINDVFWADLSIPLRKGLDYNRYSEGAESNVSLLWNMDQIDAQFPFLAMSSIGGDNWNLQFGRDILNYGSGQTGNFTISDDGSYHDYFKATTFWDKFKYTLTLVQIEIMDVDGLDPYVEYEYIDADGDPETDDDIEVETSDSRNKLKIFIDHTFEFRPIKQFSISFHEVTIRGGGEMTIGFLNPFMVMHNVALTDRRSTIYGNSLLTLSSIITPVKNINIYGEAVLDQFETPSETDRNGEDYEGDPNAYGYLFGVNYLFNLNDISLMLNAEYAYTNPHLYRSTNSWSIYALTRWYHSIYNDSNDGIVEPLGYEYGPDISLIKISLDGKFLHGKLGVYLEYLNILKGEANLDDRAESGQEAADKETPSGDTVFERNIITLKTEYSFTNNFSIYSQLNGLFFHNIDNEENNNLTDFQIVFGVSLKY